MKKSLKSSRQAFIAVLVSATALVAIFYPKVSSADFVSMLSSVFVNKGVEKAQEISLSSKNTQTMSLLSAPLNPLPASRTKNILANAVVGNSALTNENSPVGSGTGVVDSYASDRISLYTVHPGDTIQQIAEMYNVSVSTILWANDMNKGSVLQPNQVIVILPISGIKHTVKNGDTIASIAKKYKADEEEIYRFNDLVSGAKLAVGDEIIIPNGEIGEAPATKTNTSSSKGGTTTGPSGSGNSSGYLTRPVIGGVRTQGIHGHNGVDLASSYGAPILAAADGQVVLSKSGAWNGGYGNYIVVKHNNGMQTLYAHLSQTLVSAGDFVSKGQTIGKMGSTGDSTGVHLHFEVRGGKNPF